MADAGMALRSTVYHATSAVLARRTGETLDDHQAWRKAGRGLNDRSRTGGPLASASAYSLEQIARLGLGVLAGVFVARYLGPERLGLVNFAAAVFTIVAPVALLGMYEILVREFSLRAERDVLLISALGRQLPVALVITAASATLIAATRGFDADTLLVTAALLPLPVLILRFTVQSYLEATGQVRRIVAAGLIGSAIAFGFRLIGVLLNAPIWFFALAASVEAGAIAVGLLAGTKGLRDRRPLRRLYRPDLARSLLRESWPLIVATLATTIYLRIDVFMLGVMSTDEATGIYVAAAQISEVWYFIPVAGMAAARPRLARLFARNEMGAYEEATQRLMTVALVASVAVVGLTLITGGRLIQVLYGSAFVAADPVLRIHILAAPFAFLGVAGHQWFIDRGRTRDLMLRSSVGAAANVSLNLVLIPMYGPLGAAIATLVSYSLSGFFFNALQPAGRQLFRLQIRSLLLRWR